MSLGKTRITLANETAFAHEREAIDFAIEQLPNDDPYQIWGLVELLEPSTGRLYEIDLLALGYSALYLIEIKSGPGTYTGDSVDWWRTPAGEPPRYMENPYRLTNHKAKVLSSLLGRKMARAPWVQPLVFLSHPELKNALSAEARVGVVTRDQLKRAITHHEFPGSPTGWQARRVDKVVARELGQALASLGVKPRKGQLHAGEYELRDVLEDGPGYQDRAAVHRGLASMHRRARVYLVPQQTSIERRSQLRRAADREASLLDELREHPNILQFQGYVADAPLGPTVFFDAFEGGIRLDAFLRAHPDLSFDDRIELISQIGRALGYCHRKSILHGGLSPEAVLVRKRADKVIEVRLLNFQLGSAADRIEGTAHVSALTAQGSLLYQAPEVRENPLRRDVEGDVFSLGVLAYLILTGQPPAADLPSLDERLAREGELDPRAADDTLPGDLPDLVLGATKLRPTERFNDANEWVELLVDAATAPGKSLLTQYVDPLVAKADDWLTDTLKVVGAVGQGATARVLKVAQTGSDRELAVKVSLGPEHDERIRAEAATLAKLRDPHIVEYFDVLTIGGRAAVLVAFVGRTLQKQIANDGSIVLDYAIRWGEDLLDALETLEQHGITHRDLKPANVGIGGPSNKAERLIVFDFSLTHVDPKAVDNGTAVYRDPYLRGRGQWDAAADRWSAALILHEMLTGVRPGFAGGTSSLDREAKMVLSAERFPAGVRPALVAFFEKAFQRNVGDRFPSAEAMRRAWLATITVEQPRGIEVQPEGPHRLTDEEITRIPGDAMIASLPFSERAKNALDRAGALRVRDLQRLPENRLSAIRGVGRLVAKEILDFRERWRLLRSDVEAPLVPFFAGYRGEDLLVEAVGLEALALEALVDAGLRTLVALASAPEDNINAIAERRGFDVALVRRALDAEHRRAEERAHPVSLEGWIDALLPQKKPFRTARVLFGLEAAGEKEALPLGANVRSAAQALGQTGPAIYIAIGKDRLKWSAHPAIGELIALARRVVEEAGGAVLLRDAADWLLTQLPHDRAREPARLQIEAAALLRVVAELRKKEDEEPDAAEVPVLPIFRVDDLAWLAIDPSVERAVKALGAAADELALRTPLASPPETQRFLLEAAGESPLARLPFEQLAQLASRASKRAACSTRLELYPRGMPAERALELTAALLTNGVKAEEVQKRVRDRYPDAAPIPPPPDLDKLLERFGLFRAEGSNSYLRPGTTSTTTQHTSFARTTVVSTPEFEDLASTEFEERLRLAVERRALRILPVHAHLAKAAEKKLARFLGVPARPLDLLLIEGIERWVEKRKVQPQAIHDADREGPAGKNWTRLLSLADKAAEDLEASLLPARETLLLTQPGLLARYRLRRVLDAIVAASKRDDSACILLLLPSHDRNGAPVINDDLAIPGLLPSERLWVPSAWIQPETPPPQPNAHA